MLRRLPFPSALVTGLVVGLAIGGALTIGLFVGQRTSPLAGLPGLAELKLKAMASHGADTFAIATGPVDEETEALFTLDYVTGDLQCFVVNTKTNTGGLLGWFGFNVSEDLGLERGKKPNYLIATGRVGTQGSYANARPAQCVVYVANGNTGAVGCYSFFWNKAQTSVGQPQQQPMVRVHKWPTRSVAIRK